MAQVLQSKVALGTQFLRGQKCRPDLVASGEPVNNWRPLKVENGKTLE